MATVIKSEHLTKRGSASLQMFNLLDYETQARQIIAAARKRADVLLAEAAVEADHLRAEARKLGHREGVAQGLEEGRSAGREEALRQATDEFQGQQANLVLACEKAIACINEQRQRLFLAARSDVIKLAIAIARRVVKRLADLPGAAEAIAAQNAAEALEMAGKHTDPVLHVNPADLQAMETFVRALVESASEKRHIRLVADATVERGGCVLTTLEGQIDAALGTQLDRIAALLVGDGDGDELSSR